MVITAKLRSVLVGAAYCGWKWQRWKLPTAIIPLVFTARYTDGIDTNRDFIIRRYGNDISLRIRLNSVLVGILSAWASSSRTNVREDWGWGKSGNV